MTSQEKTEIRNSVHDLNNALNAINLQSEVAMLRMEQEQVQEAFESMRAIREECRRAAQLGRALYERLEPYE